MAPIASSDSTSSLTFTMKHGAFGTSSIAKPGPGRVRLGTEKEIDDGDDGKDEDEKEGGSHLGRSPMPISLSTLTSA